jgi:YVTN family beta-propeller protein
MSLDSRARRAAQAARTSVDRLPPPPGIGDLVTRRRRRAAAANTLALALIVAVVGVAWRALPPGREPAAPGLPGGPVQAAIRVGTAPSWVLVAEGSVWVANSEDGTVSRIDPATNRVTATIQVGGHLGRLTADSGAVWVFTTEGLAAFLRRIDPASNRVAETLPLPRLPVAVGDVLAADGFLWVSVNDGTVRRLDPADGRVSASIPVAHKGVSLLASGGGRLWAAQTDNGTVVAINPRQATVTQRFPAPSPLPSHPWRITGLAVVGGVVWESTSDAGLGYVRVDSPPNTTVQGWVWSRLDGSTSSTCTAGRSDTLIAAGPAGMFVYRPSTRTIKRLDPATLKVMATIRLPGLCHVAVGADAVWATADTRGMLYRIDPQATKVDLSRFP